MKKILVTYFSRTGLTQGIAETIAKRCNADIEPIRILSRSGNKHGVSILQEDWQQRGFLRSMYEALAHTRPDIEPCRALLDDYECIIIGTPVWMLNIASPMRSFLRHHDFSKKQIAIFCTCGGYGASKVLRDIEKITGKTSIARMTLNKREILMHQSDEKIQVFTNKLKSVLENTDLTSDNVALFE